MMPSFEMNLRRLQDHYAGRLPKQSFMPVIYQIEPTNACNLSCVMCPQSTFTSTGLMPYDMFERLIDEIAPYAKLIKLSFIGEPLLHPHIAEFIRLAKQRTNAAVVMFSNGSLLTRKKMVEIKNSGLDEFILSLDGLPGPELDSIRRGLDSQKVVDNIEDFAMLTNGIVKVAINCIAFDITAEQRKNMEEFWRARGAVVHFSPVTNWAGQYDSTLPGPSKQSACAVGRVPCSELWYKSVVRYNGEVVMCCNDYKGEVSLGSFNQTSLAAIWNSDLVNSVRDSHRSKTFEPCKICSSCSDWSTSREMEIAISSRRVAGAIVRP